MDGFLERRYPIGIQTFSEIVNGHYVYVDKTAYVYRMTHAGAKYYFLARPRRFGKSLLSSTLRSYFEGRQNLFKGLTIETLEKEWTEYPVLHLDLSLAKNQASPQDMQRMLMFLLRPYAEKYGRKEDETTPGSLIVGLIQRAHELTGRQVAVIVDEYDAPLLEVLHTDEALAEYRRILQEFYQPLKAMEPHIRFCFITGITKFSQLSIFSTINNLKNISMDADFSAVCGITESELGTTLAPDIEYLAIANECTPEEIHDKLKMRYDGYHFAHPSEDIYNPFSLLFSFDSRKLDNYWFSTGTPSYLIRQMQYFHTDITTLDNMEVPAAAFDRPTEAMTSALPILYQSGYLTIKDFDKEVETYILSIPNQEVRIGFTEGLLPTYIGLDSPDVQIGFAARFWRALKKDDINQAMEELQAYLASLPYVEGFKKKLAEVSNAEGFYEWTFYLIFSMLNVYARTQVKTSCGRADIVVHMPDTIYVFELKTSGTALEALEQIKSRGYAIPYSADRRNTIKVGIKFSIETKTIEGWAIEGETE